METFPIRRPRLCCISYKPLSRLIKLVADDYASRAEIEVIDETFDSALAAAQVRERLGLVDAFVSAGANAALLRNTVRTPVATVKITGFDLMLALMEAARLSEKVGVVTYRETIAELDTVRALLKLDIAQMAYRTPEEARNCFLTLTKKGYPVIVGSSIVVDLAEQMGLRGILSYSTAGVHQAFEDAIALARVAQLETARFEQVDGVLQHLRDAVLAVDREHRIIAINPTMSRVLGLSSSQAVGRDLDEIEPELSLKATLSTGEETLSELVTIGKGDWIANRSPIRSHARVQGAVLTLYDTQNIQSADSTLRSQRHASGPPRARYRFDHIQGTSPAFTAIVQTAQRYARSDASILITGESGTGKEMLAQAIHHASPRRDRPFVAANCAAFPEQLLESELFGYDDGAFTGARKGGKPGLFEAAHTGTLLLDEIGDMPLSLQTRLLRVLQEKEVVRLGSTRPIPINVRIIAATHQSLLERVKSGAFRADLYYRLNILRLRLPALRERREDIVPLMLQAVADKSGDAPASLNLQAALQPLHDAMRAYDWPGNIRELHNIAERLAIYFTQYTHHDQIDYEALCTDCPELLDERQTTPLAVAGTVLLQALARHGGRRAETAHALGISRATLWRRLRELGLDDVQAEGSG
jgi:propionate catabolism operon transcriptional regulator